MFIFLFVCSVFSTLGTCPSTCNYSLLHHSSFIWYTFSNPKHCTFFLSLFFFALAERLRFIHFINWLHCECGEKIHLFNLNSRNLIELCLFNRMKGEKVALAYVTTHVRFSSWLIGVITGYFFVEARKKSVQIPKVSIDFCLQLFFVWNQLCFTLGGQSRCVDVILDIDVGCDSCELSIHAAWYYGNTATVWIIWCTESSCLVDCHKFHHFCLCSWSRRNCQQILITSILSTNFKTVLFNLYAAYGSGRNYVRHTKGSALLQWIQCGNNFVHFQELNDHRRNGKFNRFISYFQITAFISIYVVSVFVSIITCLAFESPIQMIEKVIFRRINNPETNTRNKQCDKQQNVTEIQQAPLENDFKSILESSTESLTTMTHQNSQEI